MKVRTVRRSVALEQRLLEMAADPEIQRELGRVKAEFRSTEGDGLGT